MVWLERGEFPRQLWWDNECRDAQIHVRECERVYHQCQSQFVRSVRSGTSHHVAGTDHCTSVLVRNREAYRVALHKYRDLIRQKERRFRTGRRNRL